MSRPTAAALRSAKNILNHLDEEAFPLPLAAIIDREFAELLTICREISKWARVLDDGGYDGGLPLVYRESLDAILEKSG